MQISTASYADSGYGVSREFSHNQKSFDLFLILFEKVAVKWRTFDLLNVFDSLIFTICSKSSRA